MSSGMHGTAEDDQAVETGCAARQRLSAVREERGELRAAALRDLAHDAGRRNRAALHDQQPRRAAGGLDVVGGGSERAPRTASYNHLKSLQGPDLRARPADPKRTPNVVAVPWGYTPGGHWHVRLRLARKIWRERLKSSEDFGGRTKGCHARA